VAIGIADGGPAVAAEYSNAIDRRAAPRDFYRPLSCPNDHERPRRREFASRGQGFKSPQLHQFPQVRVLMRSQS